MAEEPTDASSRPTSPWLVGIVGAALGGLVTWAATRPAAAPEPEAAICVPGESGWDGGRADATFAAWSGDASGARVVLRRDLDAWFERWETAKAEACTRPEHERPAVDACLDDLGAQGLALADVLRDLDADRRANAWAAARSLPATEDCAVAAIHPRDPDVASTLHRAAAREAVGDTAGAAAQLDALALADDDPSRARWLWLRGHAEPADAQAHWIKALGDAIAMDDPALVVRVSLDLSAIAGDRDDAQRWWALASAHARRLPSTNARQHALLSAQGRLLQRAGAAKAAVSVYEPALALLEAELGGTHPALVPDLRRSAETAGTLGQLDAAEGLAKRALEIVDASLGARHDEALSTLDAIAAAVQQAGAPQRATAWLRMAVERRGDATQGPTIVALGRAYLGAGRLSDAADSFHAATQWLTKHGPDDELALAVELGEAALAQARGTPDLALGHLRAALELAPARDAADVRVRLIIALADAGDLDAAQLEARASLSALVRDGADDATLGATLSAAADVALRAEQAA
ncbi:MAG: tetratricopeptide repeat protein, partial [Myxococcota bacterium]